MSRASISIVIPAHDEEANINQVVALSKEALRRETDDYEVVVVDDASTDSTLALLQDLAGEDPEHVRVIASHDNIGCHGAALLGLRHARSELRFFIPADLQILPDQLHRCLPAMEHADFVCTNRTPRADPFHRRLMSRGYNLAVRLAFGIRVHDVDSTILVRREVIEAIADDLTADSDFIPVEMLARAISSGFRMTEVRIEHHPRAAGQPTALTAKEAMRTLVTLGRSVVRLRRLRGLASVVTAAASPTSSR
jgi:glycosyltransferase involved in cell wall biosynthesis